MKVLLACHGTRGDVQPFVALADTLVRAGHQPLLAAPAASAEWISAYNLPFAPLSDEMNVAMADPEIRAAIESNFRGLKGKRVALRMLRQAKPELRRLYDEIAELPADDVDLIVHPINSAIQHLAEKVGVPAVAAALQPGWVPTPSLPSPQIPFRIPGRLNRWSYLPNRLILRALVRSGSSWRSETLGLPRRRHQNDALQTPDGHPSTVLQAFSQHLLPPNANYPPGTHTTGFWFLPAAPNWTPPDRLTAFLDARARPVYIGFGSMAGREPARVGQMVTEAVRLAGVRAVLVTGWGGIDIDDDDRLLVLDQAPHAWLFPRMSAIAHHGGAGTTAAALVSGRPQVVCPFIADQPMWARIMHALGVAPDPIPQRHLTTDRLADALRRAVTDNTIAQQADALGAKIRAENGVGHAIGVLENFVHTDTW